MAFLCKAISIPCPPSIVAEPPSGPRDPTAGDADYEPANHPGRNNYHRARYYDPTLGRWLSEDPIGLLGGDASFYAYVLNDPINAMDPSGFQSMPNQSDSAVYPPTYNCSFVSECVDTINDIIDGPEVIDLPDRGDDGKPRRRSPVGKIGKEVLVEAVKQGGVRTLCEYNNSCQCAGTCPDDPPWPPETDSSPVPDSDQPAQCTSQ